MSNLLVFGASRGLGAGFNLGLPQPGDRLWTVSRSRPEMPADGVRRTWIQADLSRAEAASRRVAEALGAEPLDLLLYNAGIWESEAFEPEYDFAAVPAGETEAVLAVNLTAPILCIQRLLPNLRRAAQARVILVGSTSGLENSDAPEVAYGASKFGLRGVAHSLRQALRPDHIAVTCLNVGSFATDLPYQAGREAVLRRHGLGQLPMHDLVALVRCLMDLSPAACVKEIDMPAMDDTAA